MDRKKRNETNIGSRSIKTNSFTVESYVILSFVLFCFVLCSRAHKDTHTHAHEYIYMRCYTVCTGFATIAGYWQRDDAFSNANLLRSGNYIYIVSVLFANFDKTEM